MPRPTSRGRYCVPPAPGIQPRVTSGRPNCAVSDATRRSHASASSRPPPRAYPRIIATTGLMQRRRRWGASISTVSRFSTGVRPDVS